MRAGAGHGAEALDENPQANDAGHVEKNRSQPRDAAPRQPGFGLLGFWKIGKAVLQQQRRGQRRERKDGECGEAAIHAPAHHGGDRQCRRERRLGQGLHGQEHAGQPVRRAGAGDHDNGDPDQHAARDAGEAARGDEPVAAAEHAHEIGGGQCQAAGGVDELDARGRQQAGEQAGGEAERQQLRGRGQAQLIDRDAFFIDQCAKKQRLQAEHEQGYGAHAERQHHLQHGRRRDRRRHRLRGRAAQYR